MRKWRALMPGWSTQPLQKVGFLAQNVGLRRFLGDFSEGVRVFSGKWRKKLFVFCFFCGKDLHFFTKMFTKRAVCAKYGAEYVISGKKQDKVRVGERYFSTVNIFKIFLKEVRGVW